MRIDISFNHGENDGKDGFYGEEPTDNTHSNLSLRDLNDPRKLGGLRSLTNPGIMGELRRLTDPGSLSHLRNQIWPI